VRGSINDNNEKAAHAKAWGAFLFHDTTDVNSKIFTNRRMLMRIKLFYLLAIFILLIMLVGITNNHKVLAITNGDSAVFLPLVLSNYPCEVDNYDSTELRNEWHWLREDPTHWSLSARPGFLRIVTQNRDIWGASNNAPILLQQLQPPTSDKLTIRTRVVVVPQENFHQGGLIIYQDDDNYVRLTFSYIYGPAFEFGNEIMQAFNSFQVAAPNNVNDFHLQIIKNGMAYTGYYSLDGNSWTEIGTYNSVNILPNQIGLIAFGAGSTLEIPADFDYFQYCR
jgi:beta-xylosidase